VIQSFYRAYKKNLGVTFFDSDYTVWDHAWQSKKNPNMKVLGEILFDQLVEALFTASSTQALDTAEECGVLVIHELDGMLGNFHTGRGSITIREVKHTLTKMIERNHFVSKHIIFTYQGKVVQNPISVKTDKGTIIGAEIVIDQEKKIQYISHENTPTGIARRLSIEGDNSADLYVKRIPTEQVASMAKKANEEISFRLFNLFFGKATNESDQQSLLLKVASLARTRINYKGDESRINLDIPILIISDGNRNQFIEEVRSFIKIHFSKDLNSIDKPFLSDLLIVSQKITQEELKQIKQGLQQEGFKPDSFRLYGTCEEQPIHDNGTIQGLLIDDLGNQFKDNNELIMRHSKK
jgi:hypothetical protein